jgi:Transposase, Mutator family/PD-(D/E)XK nuclease superfamily
MPLAFNVFGALGAHPEFICLFRRVFDNRAIAIEDVTCEWSPRPKGLYLSDNTAFDAAVRYLDADGHRCLLGVEVKYTEPFSTTVYDEGRPYRTLTRTSGWFRPGAYVTGTSTRKVDDLVRALGCDSGLPKSTVSRICAGIDEEVAVFRSRRLDHLPMPYVYLDATYIKARHDHRIVSRAVVVATAVTGNGDREVLGVDVGDSEDEVFWTAFLRGLKTVASPGCGGARRDIAPAHALSATL